MSTAIQPQPAITDTFQAYVYYRSSCSGRLRIALNLKSIKPTYKYINLIKKEQRTSEYTLINPSHTVPTLIITPSSGSPPLKLTQSIPALEYLEEAYPSLRPLLPAAPAARATVRTLTAIIAADVQPITNLSILNRVEAIGGDKALWAREIMTQGLLAYEAVARESAGEFSVGDEVSLADVCLVPAVWGAERFGVDFGDMPTVRRVYEKLAAMEEVKRAHWSRQEDTPEELRA
ncbi:maleylacetoacetate isomerase [Pseudogymnoascus sp. 23342-1-I1]|nr:maleylacetoacetate isomerase [Pseudogymnoascus sp. 23342-1-I1]